MVQAMSGTGGRHRHLGHQARSKNLRTGLLFAAPWMVGFALFVVYPVAASFYYAFTSFNVFQPPRWTGIENLRLLFRDSLFWKSLANTLYITAIASPLNIAFGILLARALNTNLRGRSLFRTAFYVPYVIPLVATSLLWIWLLNPDSGMVNGPLRLLGIPGPNWLGSASLTKPSLILIGLWRSGPIMVVFLAALQEVPTSLYEAANMDGCGPLRRFFGITLPLITPAIFFQVVMQLILNFQYFTEAFLVSGAGSRLNENIGGPQNSILFYGIYLYHTAFTYLKMGKASAMAEILFLLVAALTWVLFRTSKRWVNYGE